MDANHVAMTFNDNTLVLQNAAKLEEYKIFQFYNMEHGDLTGDSCVMEDKFFFVVDRNMIMEIKPKQVFLEQTVKHEISIEEVKQ